MKGLLPILLITLSTFSIGQTNGKVIEYEVELTDPMTGLVNQSPYWDYDLQFYVKYDSVNVVIWKKHSEHIFEKRIINKVKDEVLLLASEGKNKYTFYYTIATMKSYDRMTLYGDTIIKITDERKEILGYECKKIEMSFGKQASATLWVTDSLNTGLVVPNTPLTYKSVALEYIFETPSDIYKYTATEIKDINESIDDTSIPNEYLLVVPHDKFNLDRSPNKDKKRFEFVKYPKYSKGKEKLHEEIRSICTLTKTTGNDEFNFNVAYISLTINKDSTIENIKVEGISDEKEVEEIISFLSKTTFIPAEVKGEKVNSSIQFSVNLNE